MYASMIGRTSDSTSLLSSVSSVSSMTFLLGAFLFVPRLASLPVTASGILRFPRAAGFEGFLALSSGLAIPTLGPACSHTLLQNNAEQKVSQPLPAISKHSRAYIRLLRCLHSCKKRCQFRLLRWSCNFVSLCTSCYLVCCWLDRMCL